MSHRVCDVCGKPFTVEEWENRHDYHEPDCPNFVDYAGGEERDAWQSCECDLVAHEHCCPQCNA